MPRVSAKRRWGAIEFPTSGGGGVLIHWHRYDDIAGRYEEICGPRFETAANLLVSRLEPRPGCLALDIGTGTGAVLRALDRRFPGMGVFVGCDLSGPMLAEARQQMARLRVVRADSSRLPFRSGSVDLATASFVLSHVPDYREVLRETVRVLRRSATFGAASWAPATDVYIAAWRELLGSAVEASLLERASAEALPWEIQFEDPQRVREALEEAGFTQVGVETVEIQVTCSTAEFVADRAMGASARYARLVLGEDRWQQFLERARGSLEGRFGGGVSYRRGVILGTGIRA